MPGPSEVDVIMPGTGTGVQRDRKPACPGEKAGLLTCVDAASVVEPCRSTPPSADHIWTRTLDLRGLGESSRVANDRDGTEVAVASRAAQIHPEPAVPTPTAPA